MNKVFGVMILIIFPSIAISSNIQCQKLSKLQARKAYQFLNHFRLKSKHIPIVDYYCEQCLDSYVRPIVMDDNSIQVKRNKNEPKTWNLFINGEVLNVAHLFLNNVNLGYRIGCMPKYVSKRINF